MPREDMLARRLRERRKLLGLHQRELGAAIGATQATISQYETGEVGPTIEGLVQIAQKLETSVDWLLGLTNDISPEHKHDGTDKLSPLERETLRFLRGFTEDQQRLVLEMLETIQRMIPHKEH